MKVFFDIRTLSLFSGFISACLFVCMAYIYQNRKTYPGFNQWVLAFLLNFIGFVLLSLRNIAPVFITVILANTLIVLCFSFIARGLNDFAEVDQNIWADISPIVVFIVSFYYFSYTSPNVNARIVTVSLAFMLICLRCAAITVRQLPKIIDDKNLLLLIIFVSIALWFFLRAVLTISSEEKIKDFMSAGVIHGLSIIAVSIDHIMIAVGLIIINTQRLEKKINERTTELTDLNDSLTDSEVKFRSLSDASFEGIAILKTGILLEVNNTMSKMFGYSTKELVGMESIALIATEVRQDVESKIVSGYEKPYETIGIRKDGTKFPIEIHGKMFSYKAQQVRVTAIRDLTEQKKTEEALLESERMQGVLEIAGAVCHEMNQPLMAITGYSDLISVNLSEDDPLFDKITKIREQAGRMAKITQRLMNITKYETKNYLRGKIIDIDKSSNDK